MVALVGVQLLTDMLSVIDAVPVSLTYKVTAVVMPGARVPQAIAVRGLLQALSEYTPVPGAVVIVPVEVIFWLTVIVATVVAISAKAAMATAIINDFWALGNGMKASPSNSKYIKT